MAMKVMTIRLPEDLHYKLRKEAWDKDESMNGMLITLLQERYKDVCRVVCAPNQSAPCWCQLRGDIK